MDLTPMLDHLSQLEWNNNREWFRAHSRERKAARADFEGLVLGLMLGLAQDQPGILDYRPADLTYSLVRDPRRPHPEGPYHTAFRAVVGPWGRTPVPVSCYLHVQPGDRSYLGGGLFARCFREATAMVRDRIAAQGDRWREIVEAEAESPEAYVAEHGRFPILDRSVTADGDPVITTGDGHGNLVKYTFTE